MAHTLPPAAPKKIGAALIGDFVKNLPESSGVYRMLDNKGEVLYVGKAKNLKKRVSSYASGRPHSTRLHRMIAHTCDMAFVYTHSEAEALLLEANFIKRYKPPYNVLLRDDKSFPYILLTGDHPAPALMKYRGAQTRKGSYFGPFASNQAVNETIDTLQKIFLLRTCRDSFFANRVRPCLLYQIKRCSAPCTGVISPQSYKQSVAEAEAFLNGKSREMAAELTAQMQQAAIEMNFEAAARLRDRLAALAKIQSHQTVNLKNIQEADVFAIFQEYNQACIEVFFLRHKQNWGNRTYFPKAGPHLAKEEILSSFILQFYDNKPIPKLILLSDVLAKQNLVSEALTLKAGYKVEVATAQRGERRAIITHALANAKQALAQKHAETATQQKLLAQFAERFQLPPPLSRIEIYDNSHIMGSNAIGAMVVFGVSGFIKNQYRKFLFNAGSITPGDDFAMMKQMLYRRLKRLVKEHSLPSLDAKNDILAEKAQGCTAEGEDFFAIPPWPDVLLIDGGAGQVHAVHEVLTALHLQKNIKIIGVAKGVDRNAGRERFFLPHSAPFSLEPNDPVLYFIQRLRDEAHRFAITNHRKKRHKENFRSQLDEIEGIGRARKNALLHYFGSTKEISQASVIDLMKVAGISKSLAEKIVHYFKE